MSCVLVFHVDHMSKLFISALDDGYGRAIQTGFEFLGSTGVVRSSDRVAIKPNLTFPHFRQGVMTNPEALEALVLYLKQFTDHIVICESDSGGYNPFSMHDVFEATGIAAFAHRYGVRVVNLSDAPSRPISIRSGLKRLSVPLPRLLLDETSVFITVPVPKVHLNTVASIGVKNQWGVIQQPSLRLKLHPYFNEVIYQVNKALPRSIAVVDGQYGLTHSGPMRGTPVHLNWLAVGDDVFRTDLVVADLMGFRPAQIPHLRHIFRKEGISSLADVEIGGNYDAFKRDAFYLRREWTDYPGLLTFHSRALAYVGYESALAKPLHWLLYKFREPFY
jgi:uncharacterized protein (DUF362 family)